MGCRPGVIVFEAGSQEDVPPRNGWVRCKSSCGQGPVVEYLPEGVGRAILHAHYAPTVVEAEAGGAPLLLEQNSRPASGKVYARARGRSSSTSAQRRSTRSAGSTRSTTDSSAGSVDSMRSMSKQRGIDEVA